MSLTARKFTHISAAECLAAENDGEFILLNQDAMEPELFRRCTDWQREFYQRVNAVTFGSVGLTINVSQLYRDIDFEDPAPLPGT